MTTRKNKVDELLTWFERKNIVATKEKCPYCDFQGEDQIGMEINSEKRLSEEQMMSIDWEDGYWFNYLKRESQTRVVLVSLHTDNEFYSFNSDEVEIDYCPKCGRKLWKNTK